MRGLDDAALRSMLDTKGEGRDTALAPSTIFTLASNEARGTLRIIRSVTALQRETKREGSPPRPLRPRTR